MATTRGTTESSSKTSTPKPGSRFAAPSLPRPLVYHPLPDGFELLTEEITAHIFVHPLDAVSASDLSHLPHDLDMLVSLGATPLLTHLFPVLPAFGTSGWAPYAFTLLLPTPVEVRDRLEAQFKTYHPGAALPVRGALHRTGASPLPALTLLCDNSLAAASTPSPGPAYDPTSDLAHPDFLHHIVDRTIAQPFVSAPSSLLVPADRCFLLLCSHLSIRHTAGLLYPSHAPSPNLATGTAVRRLFAEAPVPPFEPPHRALLRALHTSVTGSHNLVNAVEAVLGPEPPAVPRVSFTTPAST